MKPVKLKMIEFRSSAVGLAHYKLLIIKHFWECGSFCHPHLQDIVGQLKHWKYLCEQLA